MKKTLITALCLIVLASFAVAFSLSAAAASAGVVPNKTELRAGDKVTIQITLSSCPDITTLSIDFDINTEVFKINANSCEWLLKNGLTLGQIPNGYDPDSLRINVLISDFTLDNQKGIFTLVVKDGDGNEVENAGANCNTAVFAIELEVLDNAPYGSHTVGCTLEAIGADGSNVSIAAGGCVLNIAHEHQWQNTLTKDDNGHWYACGVNGCNEKKDYVDHIYDNACDTTCNGDCGHTRTITHDFGASFKHDATNHWEECSVCHITQGKAAHTYDNECDEVCNEAKCGYIRTTAHTPVAAWSKDDTSHWNECANCGQPVGKAEHKFDNACDTDCNDGCGHTRTTTHTYGTTLKYDETSHWEECTECKDKKNVTAHTYDNGCDEACNGNCGYTRTPTHTPDTAWSKDNTNHWHVCTACNKPVGTAAHKFDNACDTTCNDGCGYTRVTTHEYNTNWSTDGTKHWHECKNCHVKKDEAAHTGGTATCSEKARCSACGAQYGALKAHTLVNVAEAKHLRTEVNCGSKAVYYKSCSVCKKATNETFEYGEKNAEKHVGDTVIKNARETSCLEVGYTGDTYCKTCDAKLKTGTEIPANHKIVKVEAGEASCAEAGNTEYHKCEKCDKYFKDAEAREEISDKTTVEVAALGHRLSKIEGFAATEIAEGKRSHYRCEVCNKLYFDEEGKDEITDVSALTIPQLKAERPEKDVNVAVLAVAIVAMVGSATGIAVILKNRK